MRFDIFFLFFLPSLRFFFLDRFRFPSLLLFFVSAVVCPCLLFFFTQLNFFARTLEFIYIYWFNASVILYAVVIYKRTRRLQTRAIKSPNFLPQGEQEREREKEIIERNQTCSCLLCSEFMLYYCWKRASKHISMILDFFLSVVSSVRCFFLIFMWANTAFCVDVFVFFVLVLVVAFYLFEP